MTKNETTLDIFAFASLKEHTTWRSGIDVFYKIVYNIPHIIIEYFIKYLKYVRAT